jgi:hypothetical protein
VTQAFDKLIRHQAGTREMEKILAATELEIALRRRRASQQEIIYEKLNIDGRVPLLLRMREKALS